MTASTEDIKCFVDDFCQSVHFMGVNRLLKKLDHEDLDVLRAMLEEVYESGKTDGTDDRYDEGFEDGYDKGLRDGN